MFTSRKYNITRNKELVSLRQRKLKNGGYSLLLDYQLDGIRTREFLKMYLVPVRNRIDEEQNVQTLKAANMIKARRIVEIQEGKAGIGKKQKDVLLTDYLKSQVEYYRNQGKMSYARVIACILRWVTDYGHRCTLRKMDKDFIMGYVNFMRDNDVAPTTLHTYYANLSVVMNNAYRDGLIDENPFKRIPLQNRPKRIQPERDYLTLDEVQLLAKTPCEYEMVKRAFLFSCFTGLRLSDIEALTWDKIKRSGDGLQVEERQKKTGSIVYVPLSDNAIEWLPPVREGNFVFKLPKRTYTAQAIRDWIEDAGIGKKITFHCARHTYATLLITYGTDIYTVSSLLGHGSVSATQIYAKVINEKKRNAVFKIPNIL